MTSHTLTRTIIVTAICLIGCSPPTPQQRTESPEMAEWRAENARHQAEMDREREQREQQTPKPPPSTWRMINFVNEFGEQTDQGAVSNDVSSLRPMSFPYGDTKARILIDCDRAWVRFSESPNLTGGDINDGYTLYTVSVRVDGNEARWRVNQSWGDNDLRFVDSSQAISALSGGSTFTLAVPWYGEGSVAFRWSLAGSSDAIQRSCD